VRAESRQDAGDGTVPTWSACQNGVQLALVGGEHGEIYRDAKLQQMLAVLLGKPGALAVTLPTAELALSDEVVVVDGETRAVLIFAQPVTRVDGELEIARLVDGDGRQLDVPTASKQPVRYSGAPLDRLTFQVSA